MTLVWLGLALASTVAVLPLEGRVDEASLATDGLRDAFAVQGWEALGDTELSERLGDSALLDQAREHASSGRRQLDAGRNAQAVEELEDALGLHEEIGSAWLRRTELADLHYLLAVALLRDGGDPSGHLSRASRLVEDYEPPGGYRLELPAASAAYVPADRDIDWLQERLQVDALVLGELRRGRLTVFFIHDGVETRASRPIEVAPYPGEPLYGQVVYELLGVVEENETPVVEFIEVDRPEEPSHKQVSTSGSTQPVGLEVDEVRRVDRRRAWWVPVGLALVGASAGVALALNAEPAKGEAGPPRYTVVIETPR